MLDHTDANKQFSRELRAQLSAADAALFRRCENAMRACLGMDFLPRLASRPAPCVVPIATARQHPALRTGVGVGAATAPHTRDAKQYLVTAESASQSAAAERPLPDRDANAAKTVQCAQLRSGQRDRFDCWSGTAAALVAEGVVAMGSLPGQPGRNSCTVTIRPSAGRQGASCWMYAPGYTRIARSGSGFRVEITVSLDEQARRRDTAARRRDTAARACHLLAKPFSDLDAAAERAAGVRIETYPLGEQMTGTRMQLMSTGRCSEEFFPEVSERVRFNLPPMILWTMSRRGADMFCFDLRFGAEERAQRALARKSAAVKARAPHLRLVQGGSGQGASR